MDTAPRLPRLLAELTSDSMTDLPTSARLLWILLSSRPPGPEPVRMNRGRIRAALLVTFGLDVTDDDIVLGVLMLEERGLIVTSAGHDGRERVRIARRPPTPNDLDEAPDEPSSTGPTAPYQEAPSERIAPVGRERERESESAREERAEPSRQAPGPPPPPFCPDHMPLGSGGVPCVACKDMTLANRHYELNRMNPQWADLPQHEAPAPPSWQRPNRSRPRFRDSDALDITVDDCPY